MFYADYNATAPVLPEVKKKMEPFLAEEFGNPASLNSLGINARSAVEEARMLVATLLGAKSEQVVFMSGGTEACFQAIVGAAFSVQQKRHFLTCGTEHPAVLKTLQFLEKPPWQKVVTVAGVNENGGIDLKKIEAQIESGTCLASIAFANNETGVVFPIAELAAICRKKGAMLHTDAVQAVGKIEVQFSDLGVHFLSISGHKFGAPKGIGALLIADDASFEPLMVGGGQENGRRGGTLAVAQIVGLGEACRLAAERRQRGTDEENARDAFEEALLTQLSDVTINARKVPRLGNTSSLSIDGVVATELVKRLSERGVLVSAGSACSSTHLEPSHVLRAMGRSTLAALSTLRVSFGPKVTTTEALLLAEIISEEATTFRKESAEFVNGRLSA